MKNTATKAIFCKDCGHSVMWQRSFKTYKWYLTNVDDNGETSRSDFHKCKGAISAPAAREQSHHDKAEQVIADNRDVLVASLNSLLEAPSANRQVCEGDICPPTNFKPIKPLVTNTNAKLGQYRCMRDAHTFTHLVTPGKPVICSCCSKMAKFIGLA